ncbi:TPA: hypothetical protein F8R87_13495 [Legionella pneumophila]|nr:hypothetical protein DI110_15065 [Legionella pneumophila]HAT8775217.1 hypothetical protein [Legionella pneumophila]HAU0825549.1 hypothetical protein [Legionella pneumophila]HAU1250810.1 hypothetical protein [Legionella pneumophila]HAU2194949.1 hypothetical protein [Legionella pneumophila]
MHDFYQSGLTKNPNLFIKKSFKLGHLVYLNSLIKNIFCLDLVSIKINTKTKFLFFNLWISAMDQSNSDE